MTTSNLSLYPTPETPGFNLASPRAFQVWLALFARAVRIANRSETEPRISEAFPEPLAVAMEPATKPRLQESRVEGRWTVEQLAGACGCNRNTAGSALMELVQLGWVRKSLERHQGGEFGGFCYRLMIPPAELTATAIHLYTQRADQTAERLQERRQQIMRSSGGRQDALAEGEPARLVNSRIKTLGLKNGSVASEDPVEQLSSNNGRGGEQQ